MSRLKRWLLRHTNLGIAVDHLLEVYFYEDEEDGGLPRALELVRRELYGDARRIR